MTKVKQYELCASRLEQRGWHPPSKEMVDGLIEGVKLTGVEAIIHSAVSQDCQPLFPSKVYPNCHPDASMEAFEYLIESLHAIGRPVLSWYALNHSSSIIEEHPDWEMSPISGDGLINRRDDDHHHYTCINSPYGELLPEFCKEIVRDVGFDGIWFDGASFAVCGNSLPGCICEYCQRLFLDEVGEKLPLKVDWDSHAFRLWVNWRYDKLMGTWKRCLDAILSIKPEATVCFNNYRRRRDGGSWHTGIPMRKLGWDALMSGELDIHVFHGDFQMKMHKMYDCARGQDSWQALCDHWQMWVPDVEILPIEQAAVSCASAGGVLWMGSGTDPRLVPETCAAAQNTSAPLMPYIGGETVEYAAIWMSQQTQDFYGKVDPMPVWDGWHGANELCLQSHLQSSVVFDDHVTDGDIIGKYPVLIAGNSACVSEKQAQQVEQYVEEGGILFACADFGTLDEMGYPRDTQVLDTLLGVRDRRPGKANATLELRDSELQKECGKWVTISGKHVLAEPAADAELLADVVDHEAGSWDNREEIGDPEPRYPGLWQIRRGKGAVLYMGADICSAQINTPTTAKVRLFRALLTRLVGPTITLQGPMQVTMNARRQDDGKVIVHLHNAPGTIWRYHTVFNSGELVPVHDLKLKVNGHAVTEAKSGLTGEVFDVSDDGSVIMIPKLDRNDVLLLKVAASSVEGRLLSCAKLPSV